MAKILVADDNSNIQKMVGLALKDHGIEVVAVGNGEAAVRKISDIKPDLVLADVFMPVRNGYEVCQYVKEDSALSHIPVILLVGAFDPLDEQEAQRVGADGVLKKPFVPPDPLISMVKAALVRAGVAHLGFTPAPARVEVPETVPAEPPAKVPTLMAVPKAELPAAEDESFVEEVSTRPATVTIGSGSQPLAFGSLLETAGTETEEDPASVAAAHPEMLPQKDWRALDDAANAEEEEPATAKSSWRRDAGDEKFAEEVAPSASSWREATSKGPSARSSIEGHWTPTTEKQDLSEAAGIQERVTATLTEVKSTSPAAPFAGDAWEAAIAAGSGQKTAVAEAEKPVEETREQERPVSHAPVSEAPASHAPVSYAAGPEVTEESTVREPERTTDSLSVVGVAETAAVQMGKPSTASTWFSTPPNPWDAEAKKASELASAWDAPAAAAVTEANAHAETPATTSYEATTSYAGTAAPDEIEVVSGTAASAAIPETAVMETVREEVSQVVETAAHEADLTHGAPDAKEAVPEMHADMDMDAIVAKVLARMSPGMLQEVTRDILKPVVEAIVREELEAKKR